MEKATLKITLTNGQRRDVALRQQGLSPERLAILPGTRVQRNRKKEAKRGEHKHRGNVAAYYC